MFFVWYKMEFKLLIKCFCTSCPDGMFEVGALNSEILCPGAGVGECCPGPPPPVSLETPAGKPHRRAERHD